MLLTTQYLEEADQLADRISVVDDGRVVAEGTPDELKRRSAATASRWWCGDAADLAEAARLVERIATAQPPTSTRIYAG